MPKFPDISVYYDFDRARQEEAAWILARTQQKDLAWLRPRLKKYGVHSVIEWGCGSGLLAAGLPPTITYLGVDNNAHFLAMASARNHRNCRFVQADVRQYLPTEIFGLAIAMSFLKHFSLTEYDAILKKVLAHAKQGCVAVQLATQDADDGVDFHHAYITQAHLTCALAKAGHEEVEREVFDEFTTTAGLKGQTVVVWTRRLPLEKTLSKRKWRQHLEVSDVPVVELHRYTLRWYELDGVQTPALYRDGKRVTSQWRLALDVDVPEDNLGKSANTE